MEADSWHPSGTTHEQRDDDDEVIVALSHDDARAPGPSRTCSYQEASPAASNVRAELSELSQEIITSSYISPSANLGAEHALMDDDTDKQTSAALAQPPVHTGLGISQVYEDVPVATVHQKQEFEIGHQAEVDGGTGGIGEANTGWHADVHEQNLSQPDNQDKAVRGSAPEALAQTTNHEPLHVDRPPTPSVQPDLVRGQHIRDDASNVTGIEPDHDPFKFLSDHDRSNSFPDASPQVTAIDDPQSHWASLSQGEIEPGGNETDVNFNSRLARNNHDENAAFYLSQSMDGLSSELYLPRAPSGFLDQSASSQAHRSTPTDAEARYDEGLLLIQDRQGTAEQIRSTEIPTDKQLSLADIAGWDEFGSGTQSGPRFVPQAPQRKSTTHVLESLHVKPSPQTSRHEDSNGLTTPEEHAPMDGHGRKDEATNDEDLAAMWKAALGDDDLLDDITDLSDTAQLFSSDVPWNLGESSWEVPTTTTEQSQESAIRQGQAWRLETSLPPLIADASRTNSASSHSIASPHLPVRHSSLTEDREASRGGPVSLATGSAVPAATSTYQPGQSQFGTLSITSTASSTWAGAPRPFNVWNQQPLQQASRPDLSKAQSYADKSKGGYSSPYDLPADITKPRKRGSVPHTTIPFQNRSMPRTEAPLPPRSASVYTSSPPEPIATQDSYHSAAKLPSAVPSAHSYYPASSRYQLARTATMPAASAPRTSTNIGSFFQDLPVTGPRRSGDAGRLIPPGNGYAPVRTTAPIPLTTTQQHGPSQGSMPGPAQANSSEFPTPSATGELRPPEQMDPFPNPTRPRSTPRSTSAAASRYSPIPPLQSAPRSRGNYSPAAMGTTPAAPSHQPRTSSPLASRPTIPHDQASSTAAYGTRASYGSSQKPGEPPPRPLGSSIMPEQQKVQGSEGLLEDTLRPGLRNLDGDSSTVSNSQPRAWTGLDDDHLHHGTVHRQRPLSDTPPLTTSYPPTRQRPTVHPYQHDRYAMRSESSVSPPRRSQTQSPGTAWSSASRITAHRMPLTRPTSVDVHGLPKTAESADPTMAGLASSGRLRAFPQPPNYIMPTDGREHDPLSRWRGCPILCWGFAGKVVTTFPKEVQRYISGQQLPSLKCSPGEVKTRSIRDVFPIEDYIARFPGPFRGKGKKKDVLTWLSLRIDEMTAKAQDYGHLTSTDETKKRDDRILMVQLLRVLVENDGILVGTDVVQKAVRKTFLSYLEKYPAPDVALVSRHELQRVDGSEGNAPDQDPTALTSIREALLHGETESAVWQAVDKRMWAHALLMSSAASHDLWKQVVREFVQHEVRRTYQGTESLAALYRIIAGSAEESMDELVPPSARAGLKLISANAVSRAINNNGLEGLDKWVETLTLVLSNRSSNDDRALRNLGKLLLDFDRTDAAHVCFMFGGQYKVLGYADDPQTHTVLLGRNRFRQPLGGNIMESVLLTELYEYGLSLAPSSPTPLSVQMQAHRYYHALVLAQHGYLSEAQAYCEFTGQTIRSAPKAFVQHYSPLVGVLEDLSKRLQRSLRDEHSSWISKPSIEKVSDSLFAKFNSFVAGNENDDAMLRPDGTHDNEIGPFARLSGKTPIISRPASQNDSYARTMPFTLNRSASSMTVPHDRYIPAGPYAPLGPQNQSQLSLAASEPFTGSHESLDQSPRVSDANAGYSGLQGSASFRRSRQGDSQTSQASSQNSIYPHGTALETVSGYSPAVNHGGFTSNPHGPYGYSPRIDSEQVNAQASEESLLYSHSYSSFKAANGDYYPYSSNYQPSSYEPPSSNGIPYEPPKDTSQNVTSQSEVATFDDEPIRKPPDVDNDDDFTASQSEQLTRQEKLRKDKEAEENFRKAAEADAKRGQQSGDKKAWFGGWFGKKDPNLGPGPIKAKLGEESSFYYDKDLKKWVNKKGGTPQSTPSSTPPPPRGPPSRAVSRSNVILPPKSATPPVPPLPSASSAEGRPLLSSSNNNNNNNLGPSMLNLAGPHPFAADDPIPTTVAAGAPGPTGSSISSTMNPDHSVDTPGTTISVDTDPPPPPPSRPALTLSMSDASSIDDLIGPAAARKGGTMKRAKKGRYVDVMAAATATGASS